VTDEGAKRTSFAITKRDLVVAAVTAVIVILIGGVVFGIAGIGGDDESEAAAPTTSGARTSAVGRTTTAAGAANPETHPIGVPVTKGGVTLTVNEITMPPSIPATRGPERTPQSGGKYVRLDTTIKNDSQKSMDLTCSLDVQVVLIDRDRRQFDEVDDSYEIAGNPECNDGLQPGFSTDMAYIFEVPAQADITFFGFGDPNIEYNELTWISVSK
jgi:hypothetical protein